MSTAIREDCRMVSPGNALLIPDRRALMNLCHKDSRCNAQIRADLAAQECLTPIVLRGMAAA
jgi:hypothetical protein